MWITRTFLDQRGIETLEWILIGGLITAVAVLVYSGTLGPALTAAVTSITTAITASMP
jgi:Flp pilus assembly pilin Flp